MTKEFINLPSTKTRPYSSAVRAGDYIFVSGHLGSVDSEGKEVRGIVAQTKQCLNNVKQTLAAAGASLDDVVKVTVFLRSEEDFADMNEAYQSYFPEAKPARSTVVSGLVLPSMLIEIECIAFVPSCS
jgi:2-iminobutanoate/2-iminopropanoate deaminase